MDNVFHLEINCVQRNAQGSIDKIGIESPCDDLYPTTLTVQFAQELARQGHRFYVRLEEAQLPIQVDVFEDAIKCVDSGADVVASSLPSCC